MNTRSQKSPLSLAARGQERGISYNFLEERMPNAALSVKFLLTILADAHHRRNRLYALLLESDDQLAELVDIDAPLSRAHAEKLRCRREKSLAEVEGHILALRMAVSALTRAEGGDNAA